MFRNWKTTLAGIGSIITGISLVVSGNVTEGAAAIIGGIGLLTAADAPKKP